MCASERSPAFPLSPGLLLPVLLVPALLALGCDDDAPSPALRADVATLRGVLLEDTAGGPIAEVERVADGRPVLGARLLASGAIPAARQQLERVRALAMTSEEGRGFQKTLADAYEARLRGLDAWHGYLNDGAIDDLALLDAMTTMREADQAVLQLDRAMDTITPVEPPAPAD